MGIPSDRSDLIAASFVPVSGHPNQPGLVVVNFDGSLVGGGGGSTTANQGTQGTIAQSWYVSLTDLTNVIGTAAHPVRIDPTGTTTQPISAATLPLPTGAATSANQATEIADLATIVTNTTGLATSANQTNGTQKALNFSSLVPLAFDTIQVTAVDGSDRPTTILYKTGGLGGSTVATLTIVYDGSGNFQSVVRT